MNGTKEDPETLETQLGLKCISTGLLQDGDVDFNLTSCWCYDRMQRYCVDGTLAKEAWGV